MVGARYIYRRNHHNNMYAKYELYNLSLDKLAFRKNALRCENFVCCCCWCCCFSGCYYMIRKGRSVPAKLSRCHQCRSVGRSVCVLARIYIYLGEDDVEEEEVGAAAHHKMTLLYYCVSDRCHITQDSSNNILKPIKRTSCVYRP